ncbi:MAG: hypothetical protein R6X16_15715, partial [Anaerolineae bacterium]
DEISGTVVAPDAGTEVPVACQPWGAWDAGLGDAPIKETTAASNGSTPYTCSWDPATEWDVQPGQEIAVMYTDLSHNTIIDVFSEPAAYLRLNASSDSQPAPEGNVRLRLEVANDGNADAENVTVTAEQDPTDGLLYLSDTSGVPASEDVGQVTWTFGTLAARTSAAFDVFFEVNSGAGTVLTSTVTAETSSYTAGELWERQFTHTWSVAENDTRLDIGKWATVSRPAAGQELEYGVAVCNSGSTSSGAFTVTDTPGPGQELQHWWADQPGWQEVALGPDALTARHPVLDPGACLTLRISALLAADLPVLSAIGNTATLTGGDDQTPEDNEAYWEGIVSEPWVNLTVSKMPTGGRLVPGGVVRYEIVVRNEGNIPSAAVTITDTLPAGTTYDGAWESSFWGDTTLTPVQQDAAQVVWEIPALGAGREFHMSLRLAIGGSVAPDSMLLNSVAVSSAAAELRYDDNLAPAVEMVRAVGPNLRITKTAAWWDPEHIHYDVLLDNLGSVIVSDVVITDTLPVGASYAGDLAMSMEPEQIQAVKVITSTLYDTISVELTELYPGERHWMGYTVGVNDPSAGRWYTNTATITLPAGDTNPADNSFSTVSVPPSPLQWVETYVNDRGPSQITGGAIPGTEIIVTAPSGSYNAWADPACGGCWAVEDLGELAPGDALTLAAGAGAYPLSLFVPDPFTALADSATDEVTGRAGGLDYRLVEIYGDWGGNGMTWTGTDGSYLAGLDDIPPGGTGTMRVEEGEAAVWVVWSRPLSSLDLLLNVNYGHDWVDAPYEAGHTATFTVRESDGVTVMATAAGLTSQSVPEWGGWTGFYTSMGEPWVPARPDLQPGDWVYGEVDNGSEAQVQLGEITGVLDVAGDTVSGTMTLPAGADPIAGGWCAVWVDGGPEVWFDLPSSGGDYVCDPGAAGWDLRAGEMVAVGYVNTAGHRVMTVFHG